MTNTSPSISRQWSLVSRPVGEPTMDNVAFTDVELPALEAGQVRVRNTFLSVDPYMRGRMSDARSYVAPFVLGEPLEGGAVGEVVESADPAFAVGDTVQHMLGWRDVTQAKAKAFRKITEIPGVSPSLSLSVLGLTGFTAWVGLTQVAKMKEGDVVFVSGAAGGVGTMVGQIAKLLGASRVIGSAGTPEKVELLTSKYGFDAAFNYRDGDIRHQLQKAAGGDIDVYFDNVGGEHLEAALASFADGGRAAICGAISGYSATNDRGIRFMTNIVTRGLTLKGFTVGNYMQHMPEFAAAMGPWLASGKIAFDETFVDGIENTFEAFIGLMHGANTGKMLVRL